MKKLLTLLVLIVMTSCSNDDDNNVDKGNNKSLSSITLSSGDGTGQPEVLTVIYDDNGNIKAFVADDEIVYAYKYDANNNLISIGSGLNSDPDYTFQYTNGRLSGYTDVEGAMTTAISYNEQAKTYTIGDSARQFSLKGRDIGTVSTGGQNEYTFNYDDSHKGALYNVKGDNLFVLTMFSELYQYMSVRPMTSIETGNDSYTLDNTFDADGYVTKAAINYNGEVQSILTYQYSEK